jgi:serine/threonine-protein phosphatase 2A regulatory subunit A
MLGKQLGVEFFNEKLSSMCMGWLSDDVYSIRKAAAENLKRLTELFGHDWCREQIIPKIEKMQSSASFSQRLTALYAVQVLISSLSVKIVETSLLPLVAAMSADSVANIRFTVAKTIQVAVPVLRAKDTLASSASAILLKLSSDPDRDVRFYSTKVSCLFVQQHIFSPSFFSGIG